MKIGAKIKFHSIIVAVSAALIATIMVATLARWSSKNALEHLAKEHVISVRDIKKSQVEHYFILLSKQLLTFSRDSMVHDAMRDFKSAFYAHAKELDETSFRKSVIQNYLKEYATEYQRVNGGRHIDPRSLINMSDETSFGLQYQYIFANPNAVGQKDELVDTKSGTQYNKVHQKYHPLLKRFKEEFGYYDLFLVDDVTGDIVYTIEKELDFTTSLKDGVFKNTGLGQVFKRANSATDPNYVTVSDFASYLASYDEKAAFIASPIVTEAGEKLGILILQMPVDVINTIMTNDQKWQDAGLGKTGESILVGQDYYLRSLSRFLIENPEEYFKTLKKIGYSEQVISTMAATGTNIGLQKAKTVGTEAAFQGIENFAFFKDYRGKEVLGAFAPLDIAGLNWVIVAKIDKDEAFAPVASLTYKIILFSLGVMVLVALLAVVLSKPLSATISKPIEQFTQMIESLAESMDLTRRIESNSYDELGAMAESLNLLVTQFQKTCQETIQSTERLLETAQRLRTMGNESELDFGTIQESGQNIEEMSDRLSQLSRQFKIFEDEAERQSDW